MAGRPISIAILANAAQAKREFGDVADSAEKSTGRLRSSIGTAGKLLATGLGAGLVAAGVAGVKFAQAAIEDEKAASRMAQTFTKAAGATKQQIAATEDWITKQGKALGVADDDLRPALSRLVTATKDVGEAQKLTSLAMDVSAGSGKSLEQVSTAIMKAQNGQVSSLSRLGINTKNAAGETISMAEATKRMADTFGGAAQKNADTLGGRIDRLKLMASEAGESIGSKMLPYIERFATFIMDKAVPAAQRIAGDLKERFGPAFSAVAGFVKDQLIPALRDLAEKWIEGARKAFENIKAAMDRNKGTIDGLKAAFSAVWGFIKSNLLPLLGRFYETVLPAIGKAIGVVIDGISLWMEIFRTLWNKVLQPVVQLILRAFGSLLDAWGSLLGALGKVPGFEWAKAAGDKMKVAADQARGLAKNIKDIPPFKQVTVATKYTYSGLRGPGGSGSTRGRDDDFSPRTAYDLGKQTGDALATGFTSTLGRAKASGDKVGQKVLEGIRNRLDDARDLRASILSLRDTLAGGLTGDLFGAAGDEEGTALDKFRASLTAAKTTAKEVAAAVRKLLDAKVSTGFLNSLISSGNTELIVQLAGAPDVRSLASMYEDVIKENEDTGRLVAEQVIGTRLDSVNATIRDLTERLDRRDEQHARERRQPVKVEFTAEQLHQLERGRRIAADLRAYTTAGGQAS